MINAVPVNEIGNSARTTVVFTVIGNHEHDLPLEDVIANQSAADARYVFVALHLLELPTQEPGGS